MDAHPVNIKEMAEIVEQFSNEDLPLILQAITWIENGENFAEEAEWETARQKSLEQLRAAFEEAEKKEAIPFIGKISAERLRKAEDGIISAVSVYEGLAKSLNEPLWKSVIQQQIKELNEIRSLIDDVWSLKNEASHD